MNWQAISSGITYNLNDAAPISIVAVSGVGIGPVRRLSQQGPFQHGDSDLGFRLDARTITLTLHLADETLSALDTARDTLQAIFRPRSSAVSLRATRDDGATRQIDAHVVNMLDWPIGNPERIGASQRAVVQLRCPDPAWYDPSGLSLTLGNISSGTSGFVIPVAVPVLFDSGSDIDATDTVVYSGTWPEYPTVYLVGPMTDPVLTHVTLGLTLDFTGITIASGKTYTIDLRYGYKTVTDGDGANAIDELTAASDLADWRLEPGDNDINLTASSASSASAARLTYFLRYAGL